MSEEVKDAGSSEVSEIKGYREWAAEHFPLAPGWDSATDILLRGAWMEAVRIERERCAKIADSEYCGEHTAWGVGNDTASDCIAAAIRKG